ncbi:MAG: hypothetical protein ACRENP_06885 [Longimicrobiales bacterium]
MENEPGPPRADTAITRQGLEQVIRRAVELSLAEQDAGDQVSEDELVKIAEELGLSARHARQALYERSPEEQTEPRFLDRHFGVVNVVTMRSIGCDVQIAQGRLEDYLVTGEYLQIRRRQGVNAYFEPAEDAFSSIARAFSRPSGRFHIARVQRAYLSVRPLEAGWCHVRLEMSYPEKRRDHVIYAAVFGSMAGLFTGGITAVGIAIAVGNNAVGVPLAVAGGLASAAGVFTGVWVLFRNAYRKWLGRSRDEADAVLDRLEQGEDLRPPASPWLRRLQQRLRGFGSRPISG